MRGLFNCSARVLGGLGGNRRQMMADNEWCKLVKLNSAASYLMGVERPQGAMLHRKIRAKCPS